MDPNNQAGGRDGGVLSEGRPPNELSIVEIAQRLEQVTALIEAERTRERESRQTYRAIAAEVDARIAGIRAQAKSLLDEQRRRMASFDGMLGRSQEHGEHKGRSSSVSEVKPQRPGKLSLTDAILLIWAQGASGGGHDEPLTTDEIATALTEIGYTSRASARSLKSTMNQALAKLCRQGKLKRYRIDGAEISERDTKSRARRYMANA